MSAQQFPRPGAPSSGLGASQPATTMQNNSGAGTSRDSEHTSREHTNPMSSLPFRDEKQETVVVRPYPQIQAHTQPLTAIQLNVLIHVKMKCPSLGAAVAAAAAISSSKVTTVLRPAPVPLPTAGTPQNSLQHSLHLPIQSRPPSTGSTAVPAVVATVSATRAQSPVITTASAHGTDVTHRPALTIQPHPPPAAISIQRTQQPRDTAARITLPSHPAVVSQKPQLHAMPQKTIFSTGTPVAAATVAPILSTNSIPSTTTQGAISHAQATGSTIVTMTMAPHTSHPPVVTTSSIPIAKVVPQQITSTRIQPDYSTERTNMISIPGHRASPNPVTMETRTDNRPMPVQFQYYLPAYPPSAAIPGYPLAHTFTPITSTVSTIRQYPVSAQAPSSVSAAAIAAQAGVGVASTVHLNPMLMTVDPTHARHIQGLQPASIGTQGIQPAPIGTQGIQSTAIGTQGLQSASLGSQQPTENKTSGSVTSEQTSVVLTDGATIVANPINSTFSATPAVTTVIQTHTQSSSTTAPAQGSSPRPSILRKKPASDGMAVRKSLIPPQPPEATSPRLDGTMRSTSGSPRPISTKPKPEIHVAMTTPVAVAVEAVSSQNMEPSSVPGLPNSQQPQPPIPTLIAAAVPHPQPTALSTVTAAVSAAPPASISITTVVPPPSQPVAISVPASMSSTLPEAKIKQETEPMDGLQPVSGKSTMSPALTQMVNNLGVPGNDLPPGASPRKKPRKQQHIISTEESEMMETNSTDEERASTKPVLLKAEKRKSPPKEYIDEEGVRYVPVRPRPPVTLLRHYRNPWKAAYHHFQRYSDVRVKEEKKPTLQEIANQKGIVCKAQGWKVHLCAAQLMQLTSLEHDVYSRLASLQEGLIPKKKTATDDDIHRINELIQGNMQRCKLVIDQITEAKDTMMKVLDHKDRVLKLLNKNGTVKKVSKLKRKEKS
uniref:Sin3A-associated protein a n=1 Tax=Callorhinchus milii TaxID=7868 RepID=A0A4W3JAW0_CALMI